MLTRHHIAASREPNTASSVDETSVTNAGMVQNKFQIKRLIVVGLLLAIMTTGCTKAVGKGPGLDQLDRLDAELSQGISKKSDVLLLLGEPDGSGSALFPTAAAPNDIWYYETAVASLSNLDQTILLIYFQDDIFAGYQWFSNAAPVYIR